MLASLRSSLPADLDHEVILVDDFSTDGTRSWLATLQASNLKVLLNPGNRGYAATNNTGAAAASGEILCLINNDLIFNPGWFEPMARLLLAPGLNAGLVGNVQYRVADDSLDHAGVALGCDAKFRHIQDLPAPSAAHTRAYAVTGACVMIRRDDFLHLGGFDETFINGCEDIDLCMKVQQAGKAIYVANTSRIRHHVSLSRGRTSLQNEKNSRHLFGKWRASFKREVGRQWAVLLRGSPQAYRQFIDGELDPSFLHAPHAAAATLAEAMLMREEARWARELDGTTPPPLGGQCRARGLHFSPSHKGHLFETGFEVDLGPLRSVRNIYVCGRKVAPKDPRPLALTIEVNCIHRKTIPLTAANINAGLIDPLLLAGASNLLRVSAHYPAPPDGVPEEARNAIVVTHLVIDDQRIALL